MSFRKASLAAMLAVSMTSAPVLAQSAAPAASQDAPSSEASDVRGGFIIPLIAIVAIILGILAAVGGGDEGPTSP